MNRLWLVLLILFTVPALAQGDPTPLDPETLTARELIRLPLLSGPARTSAHLAPDGDRLMHVRGTTFCLYALIGVEIGCSDMVEQGVVENRGYNIDADSISWSPDGKYMAFTTEVWLMLRDSDIWVLDVDSGRFHNMTDDGYDGRVFVGDIPDRAVIDSTPVWMPDGRLAFARHAATSNVVPPSLWTIGATGGMAEKVADLVPPADRLTIVQGMDWAPDGSAVAYIIDTRDETLAGVYVYDVESGEARKLYARPEGIGFIIRVTFSPDGQSLLLLTSERDETRFRNGQSEGAVGYYVIDMESGEVVPMTEPTFIIGAGWLPDGGLVYVGQSLADRTGGLYVTTGADVQGRKVLDFPTDDGSPLTFFAPTGRQAVPLIVNPNGRLLLATPTEMTLSVELSAE